MTHAKSNFGQKLATDMLRAEKDISRDVTVVYLGYRRMRELLEWAESTRGALPLGSPGAVNRNFMGRRVTEVADADHIGFGFDGEGISHG
jgi:hypothetical protein